MTIDLEIFKAYDVRGRYPEEINEETAYKIGRAFVQFLDVREVIVGFDMRSSSPSLFKALTQGITDQGADVISIGLCTTPLLNFSLVHKNYEAGIMISASHNPQGYNAFKLMKKKALQMHTTEIQQIKDLVLKNEFSESKKGEITQKDFMEAYYNHLRNFVGNIKDIKIVFDYGNGVGAITSKPFFDSLNIDCIHMYEEPNDNFPNHDANPHDIKNFVNLQSKIIEEQADFGIFYDGDADRCTIVDEKGEIVFPDLLLGLLAKPELKDNEGENIYFDLRFTKSVVDEIKNNGGIPVMLKVGNPFYKEALIIRGGILGGEFSGHVMFKDNYCIDDGLFCAIKTAELVCNSNKTVSELVAEIDKYHHTEEINIPMKNPGKILEFVGEKYAEGKALHIDGVHISYPQWWFSLRKSNTEPLVRLRIEADTKEILEEKREEIINIMNSF